MGMVWIETSPERGFKPVKGGYVYYPFGHLFRGYKVNKAKHDEISALHGRFLERFGMAAVFFLILWPFLRRMITSVPVHYKVFSGPLGLLIVALMLLIWQHVRLHQILKGCPISDVPMTLADRRRTVAESTSNGRLWTLIIGSGIMTGACLVLAIGSAVTGNSVMSVIGTASVALFGWSMAEGIEVWHLKRGSDT
jgi:hypothetical protein